MTQLNLTKKQWLVLSLLLLATTYGVDSEVNFLADSSPSVSFYPQVLLASSLVGIYFIPFVLYIRKAHDKWQVPLFVFPISFFIGVFASSWTSVGGNDLLGAFWGKILDKKFLADWEMALTAPFMEELVKTSIALALLYLFGRWSKRWAFLVGISVGMGFQVVEDIEYIYLGALDKLSQAVPSALYRISGSLSSHYLYTALLTVGLTSLFRKDKRLPRYKGYLWMISPVISHFFWNSPLNSGWVSALITTVSLLIFIDMIIYIIKE